MSFTYTTTRRACYVGYVAQGIVNNLSPILFIVFQTRFGLSYKQLGTLILLNFMTQLAVDILCVKTIDRLGYRGPVIAAHVCAAAGIVMLGVLPALLNTYTALVIATVTMAIGGGLLEVLVSPMVDSIPTPPNQKASAMSLLHSFYCWGQVLVVLATTLLLRAFGEDNWRVVAAVWAIIPLVNVFFFSRVPLAQTIPDKKRTSLKTLFKTPAFIAVIMLMLCAGASELTVSQWSSLFAEQGLGLSKLWGDIAGPCMFAVLMGIGRTIYGMWGAKIRLVPFMAGSAALCVVCYLLTALSGNPVFSLVGCAMCGFSVSIMWPGTFSICSARFPLGGAAMFGILAMCGDMGCSLGPWLAGVVADRTGSLKTGLLYGAIFPALMLAILGVLWAELKNSAPDTVYKIE